MSIEINALTGDALFEDEIGVGAEPGVYLFKPDNSAPPEWHHCRVFGHPLLDFRRDGREITVKARWPK